MARTKQKLTAATIATRLKQHQALMLRLEGYLLREIADKVGYANASGVWHGIQSALKRECPKEDVELMRAIMSARLLRLFQAVWKHAIKDPPDLRATDRAVKIIERLCRLHGIDKPIEIKSDMTITTEDPLEKLSIEELGNLAEMFSKFTPEDIEFLTQEDAALDSGGDGESPPDYR